MPGPEEDRPKDGNNRNQNDASAEGAEAFDHADWLSQEIGRSYLHSEAADLLALIGKPEFIEARFHGLEQFERSLQRDGYEPNDPALVTIGWGARVGEEYVNDPTQALVQFRDEPDAIYSIGLGGKGSYWVSRTIDASTPKETAEKQLEFSTQRMNSAVSATVKQFVKETWDIDIS